MSVAHLWSPPRWISRRCPLAEGATPRIKAGGWLFRPTHAHGQRYKSDSFCPHHDGNRNDDATPTGSNVPLGQVADVSLRQGAFMIFRENGRRYIPVKFSVRGRDLAGTIQDVQSRLAQKVRLPEGYHLEWAGEYDSLQKEQRRLADLNVDFLDEAGVFFDTKAFAMDAYRDRTPLMHEIRRDGVDL